MTSSDNYFDQFDSVSNATATSQMQPSEDDYFNQFEPVAETKKKEKKRNEEQSRFTSIPTALPQGLVGQLGEQTRETLSLLPKFLGMENVLSGALSPEEEYQKKIKTYFPTQEGQAENVMKDLGKFLSSFVAGGAGKFYQDPIKSVVDLFKKSPVNLPTTSFPETKNRFEPIKEAFRKKEKQVPGFPEGPAPSLTMKRPTEEAARAMTEPYEPSAIDKERISIKDQPLKVEMPRQKKQETLQPFSEEETATHRTREKIGTKIAPARFEKKSEGGENLKEAVQKKFSASKEAVKKDYEAAEQVYQGQESPFFTRNDDGQTLFDVVESKIRRLTDNASLEKRQLNTAEKFVVDQAEDILSLLKERGANVKISSLIRKSDSLGSSLNYENVFGKAKNIAKTLVKDINDAVIRELESSGIDTSAMKAADINYGKHADTFFNDEISSFMKSGTERNPESLFNEFVQNPGTFRAIETALGPEYKTLFSKGTRNLVEEKMSSFINDLDRVGSIEYTDSLNNLEPLIGKQRVQAIDKEFRRLKRTKSPEKIEKVSKFAPFEKNKFNELAAGKLKVEQSEVLAKIKTPEGRREVHEKLSKIHNGEKIYENLMLQKLHSDTFGGKVKAKPTYQDMFNTWNKEENFDFGSEMIGEENMNKVLNELEKLGKKEAKREDMKNLLYKIGKTTLIGKFAKFLWPLLPI